MKIAIVPNDPLSAYSDIDRWMDRPSAYKEAGHDVCIYPIGETDVKLASFLKTEKPDVIRTLEGGRFVVSANVAMAAAQLDIPFVPSLHGIDVECNVARKYPPEQAAYFTGCRQITLHIAKAIIATQKSYVHYMEDFGYADKTSFIPNYIDLDAFQEKGTPLNRIIHVGRLDPSDKDIPTVCLAASLVRQNIPDVEVMFVGKGPMDTELAKYGFGQIQSVPNSEIPALISSSKVTLFADPVEYTGFGIPVMESQACRRPVVFCRRGSAEFLNKYEPDCDVEYFMDPRYRVSTAEQMANKIINLLENNDEWLDQGISGRKRVENNFSRQRIINDELKLYQMVLNG